MPDQIEMPAECSKCGGTWDLNQLRHPAGFPYDYLVDAGCYGDIQVETEAKAS